MNDLIFPAFFYSSKLIKKTLKNFLARLNVETMAGFYFRRPR